MVYQDCIHLNYLHLDNILALLSKIYHLYDIFYTSEPTFFYISHSGRYQFLNAKEAELCYYERQRGKCHDF